MKKRGFTLPEVLIYLVIFVLIAGIAVSSLVAMSRALTTLRTTRGTTDSTLVAFERMVRDVRSAVSINMGASTLGTSPGVLTLDTGVKYFLSGTTLMVQEGSASASALVPSNVSFTSLIFRKAQTAASQGLKIEATVNGENMYTTAVLRGSY